MVLVAAISPPTNPLNRTKVVLRPQIEYNEIKWSIILPILAPFEATGANRHLLRQKTAFEAISTALLCLFALIQCPKSGFTRNFD